MNLPFSVIIPVFNEEAAIRDTIGHLAALRQDASFEIIVADGDPAGKTIELIRDSQVRTVCSKKGRGIQMNEGAALASGDVLVFLHADTRLPADAFTLMAGALNKPACMAGAFDLAIDSKRPSLRLIAGIASLRSRLTRIPYGDQAHFFRRSYFRTIGGFADIPLMEDVEIMQRIKKRGEKIAIIPHTVSTSPRRWEKEGVLYCTLRNWLLISLYFIGVSPAHLARLYR